MIDMSDFYGKTQAHVVPIIKPRVLLPEIKEIEFIAVDKSTECHITPLEIAERMVDYLNLDVFHTVLEPSFGTGRLIEALLMQDHDNGLITGIERNIGLLKRNKHDIEVIRQDFMDFKGREFDRIIMNPPFSRGNAERHIRKAQEVLSEDGEIVAIVPVTFKRGYEVEVLEGGTFDLTKAVTKIITIGKYG